MDLKRTYKLLSVLLKEEEKNLIDKKLNTLTKAISKISSQESLGQRENFNNTLRSLEKVFKEGYSNELATSQIKTLNELGITQYFGSEFYNSIESTIEENKFNTNEIVSQINKLKEARSSAIFSVKQFLSSVEGIGIGKYKIEKDVYEIGILIPDDDNLLSAPRIEKRIHNFNLFIRALNELSNESGQNIKISDVQSGCIEFYIEQTFEIVEKLGNIITSIAGAYIIIQNIRKLRKELEQYDVPKAEAKSIEKHEKEIIEKEINTATTNLIEDAKFVEKSRKNELTKQLKNGIKFLVKSLDEGVIIEVIPPVIEYEEKVNSNQELSENEKKTIELKEKQRKIQIKRAELIKSISSSIKEISQAGSGILQLLDGDEQKSDE